MVNPPLHTLLLFFTRLIFKFKRYCRNISNPIQDIKKGPSLLFLKGYFMAAAGSRNCLQSSRIFNILNYWGHEIKKKVLLYFERVLRNNMFVPGYRGGLGARRHVRRLWLVLWGGAQPIPSIHARVIGRHRSSDCRRTCQAERARKEESWGRSTYPRSYYTHNSLNILGFKWNLIIY